MLPLAYVLCSLIHNFDHRVFPLLPPLAHQLLINPQNRNPPSLRNQTHSLGSRSRKQLSCTSRTISIPSSTQRLLNPLPSVCLVPMSRFDGRRYSRVTPATMWPYSGKRYSHNLPSQPPATQQHSPHLAPPAPPPIPPPSYEEDSAQQAAQSRSYVYAYPQYYPGQVRYFSKAWDHVSSVLISLKAYDAWNGSTSPGFVYAIALYAPHALSTHDASTER